MAKSASARDRYDDVRILDELCLAKVWGIQVDQGENIKGEVVEKSVENSDGKIICEDEKKGCGALDFIIRYLHG